MKLICLLFIIAELAGCATRIQPTGNPINVHVEQVEQIAVNLSPDLKIKEAEEYSTEKWSEE